jgi:hypothetical protein
MKQLTVILGAGFSKLAGLPLGKDIQDRFDRDQREKLLFFGSSEWAWIDEVTKSELSNGTLNANHLSYSYVLNELVKAYKSEKEGFDNYEDFFQYLVDKCKNDKPWLKDIYSKAKEVLIQDYPHLGEKDDIGYLFKLNNPPNIEELLGIINYLISDLLIIKEADYELIANYSDFINYIKQFNQVTIFTLNHDLLLEKLFSLFEIEYSKGFSTDNSAIYDNDKPLPIFNNDFNAKIKICKLHGSIDYYQFKHVEDSYYTGKSNYFMTCDYQEKHSANRINPETKEIIQNLNPDIIPKFITGKNKPEIIKNDLMFSELFDRFENEMKHSENLLISGYSFGDEHINNELIKRNDISVINQNPYTDYPYDSKIINIKSLKELSSL